MRAAHPIYGDYHARDDGTIPCTNACGHDVEWSDVRGWWIHTYGTVTCAVAPYEGQGACPEPPGEDDEPPDPDMSEQRTNYLANVPDADILTEVHRRGLDIETTSE